MKIYIVTKLGPLGTSVLLNVAVTFSAALKIS